MVAPVRPLLVNEVLPMLALLPIVIFPLVAVEVIAVDVEAVQFRPRLPRVDVEDLVGGIHVVAARVALLARFTLA